jgi:hypothetical protein
MFAALLSALAVDDFVVQVIEYLNTWTWGT